MITTFLNNLADMIRVYEEVDGTKTGIYVYDDDGNRTLSNRLLTDGDYAYG
jgi:hypothetical protein